MKRWWARVKRWLEFARRAAMGEQSVLAGGVALFSLLAMIPALAAMLATYGLFSSPGRVAAQLDGLREVLPDEVVAFLTAQIERLARRSTNHLSIALVTTLALALWSSRKAAGALLIGLHRAYGVDDQRAPVHGFLLSLAVAAAALVGFFVLMSVVVALPTLLKLLHVRGDKHTILVVLRWPLVLLTVMLGLAALYRHGPSPRDHAHRSVWPGALVATILWLAVSWLLSMWVDQVEDYEILYGAFASALVLILWAYLSALAILIGGVVNSEIERAELR